EFDNNQSSTTAEGIEFTIDQSGPQHIEIIYWDQGGQAQFHVELSSGGGEYATVGGDMLGHFQPGSELVAESGKVLEIDPATLLGNDSDPDNDPIEIDSVQDAVNGTVELVGGKVVFTPEEGFHGDASFTYTIHDGQGGYDTATVAVRVTQAANIFLAGDNTG